MDKNKVSIKKSGVHNKGLFANKDIPKGTKIIEYLGEKITKSEAERRGNNSKKRVYIFELSDTKDIDGDVRYNPAKYINHSCEPNSESVNEGDERIWIISIKKINKGDEITFDYGYGLENYKDHSCNCGTKKCVGYIVSEKYRNKLS